jgi:hypothetical protein
MMSRNRLFNAISAGLFPAESSQFSKSLIRTLCSSSAGWLMVTTTLAGPRLESSLHVSTYSEMGRSRTKYSLSWFPQTLFIMQLRRDISRTSLVEANCIRPLSMSIGGQLNGQFPTHRRSYTTPRHQPIVHRQSAVERV